MQLNTRLKTLREQPYKLIKFIKNSKSCGKNPNIKYDKI